MSISISCKDLGMDCDFVTQREAEEVVIDSFMRDVYTEHTEKSSLNPDI
jgi:predicted small metal-binding protein